MAKYFMDYKKILLFGVYFLFALLFWPFKAPLLFAVLFSFALHPILKKIKAKIPKLKKNKTLVAVTLSLILAIFCAPIFALIFSAISQLKKLESGNLAQLPIYQKFEAVITSTNSWIQSLSEQTGLEISSYVDLNALFAKASQIILPALTSFLTQLPTFIIHFLIFIVALYFILTQTEFFKKWFYQLHILTKDQIDQLSVLLQRICNLVLVSTVVVAAAQALIVSVACLIVGYTDFIIIFMIAFFMSFVPVIGSAPVSIALIIFSVINGNMSAVVILTIAALIAGSVDNVIKTYMLTGEGTSGVHPFVALLALIGSLSLFGFTGLFLGPIICELAFQIGGILFVETEPEQ